MATEDILMLIGKSKVLALVKGDDEDSGLGSKSDRSLC